MLASPALKAADGQLSWPAQADAGATGAVEALGDERLQLASTVPVTIRKTTRSHNMRSGNRFTFDLLSDEITGPRRRRLPDFI